MKEIICIKKGCILRGCEVRYDKRYIYWEEIVWSCSEDRRVKEKRKKEYYKKIIIVEY